MKKKILLALLALLVVIQFFQIDKTNTPSDPAQDFITIENPPPAVAEMLKGACYDCHSNHTKYPWYTSIQPVGWWIRGHYRGARQNVNLSEWGSYTADDKAHARKEMAEEVEQKEMPMKSYTWMHPEGNLSDPQRTELAAWLRSKAGAGSSGDNGIGHDQDNDHGHDHSEGDGHDH